MPQENRTIQNITARLRERILESSGDACKDSSHLSLTPHQEAIVVEKFAKESGLWMDFASTFSLGTPFPSGVENDVYLNANGNYIYKVNNLMTSKTILRLFDRLVIHNSIFPQTAYSFKAFTGFGNGSVYPIIVQDFIPNEREATPIEIDTYMAALGFQKMEEARFCNNKVEIFDLHPRNVLRDCDGDLYVIDADFKVK